MAVTTSSTRRATWPFGLVLGSTAGAALAAAGAWNALIQEHLTVGGPPPYVPGAPIDQALRSLYAWYAGMVGQERGDSVVALVGVTGLVLMADALRRRLDGPFPRIGDSAMVLGGLVWMVGAIAQIGGHRAVAVMAAHGTPVQTVNSIAFTVDVTANTFSAAAFMLLGFGMTFLGGALLIAPLHAAGARWAVLTTLSGLVSLVVAVGYVRGVDPITTWVLGLLAAVLLPAWLVSTGQVVDRAETS